MRTLNASTSNMLCKYYPTKFLMMCALTRRDTKQLPKSWSHLGHRLIRCLKRKTTWSVTSLPRPMRHNDSMQPNSSRKRRAWRNCNSVIPTSLVNSSVITLKLCPRSKKSAEIKLYRWKTSVLGACQSLRMKRRINSSNFP